LVSPRGLLDGQRVGQHNHRFKIPEVTQTQVLDDIFNPSMSFGPIDLYLCGKGGTNKLGGETIVCFLAKKVTLARGARPGTAYSRCKHEEGPLTMGGR